MKAKKQVSSMTLGGAKTVARMPESEDAAFEDSTPHIEGYEITRELGRGGMGVVFKATQQSLGRAVAIKMILSVNAEGEERVRFMSEAEAIARFHHPNIVQIYEVGEAEGRPYFSLEYVEGSNLEENLDKKPLAWKSAAELLVILARAVHDAHEQGIVHRDLKPANILIGVDGTPKITDFGIAKRLDAADQTQMGKILGTPCYMAPEQAMGRTDQVGPGADIYALGAILYDALTGRPPFEADNTMDTLMQAITREPVPPRALQPKVPRDLNIICLKCLEKDIEKRYSTALELAEDLERLMRSEPILARPIGKVEWVHRWAKRNPAWSAVIAVSMLALVGLIATGTWFTRQLQLELAATEAARKDALEAHQQIRMRLVRSSADAIATDLKQIAKISRVIANALAQRTDWTEKQLSSWLRAEIQADSHLFAMAVAFEPHQFESARKDFCLYAFRDGDNIEVKQLLPPDYSPIYRDRDWYNEVSANGTWGEPYVDDGGGEIPMVTFSVPFERHGIKAGIVTVDLALEYFQDLGRAIRKSNLGDQSYTFVMTHSGTIVSHPQARFRFPAPMAKLPEDRDHDLWNKVQKGQAGSAEISDLLTGNPVRIFYAPVEVANWSVVAVAPR